MQAECLGEEELLDHRGVEGEQVVGTTVRQPTAVGQEHLEMGVPAQKLVGGLEYGDCAGNDMLAIERCPKAWA